MLKRACLIFFLALSPLASAGDSGCRISLLTTCSRLSRNQYPDDSTNWFYPSTHPQVVFFAHMIFPLRPELDEAPAPGIKAGPANQGPWHPPLFLPRDTAAPDNGAGTGASLASDLHYAQAIWYAPDDQVVASFGQTMPARAEKDILHLQGRDYIPHTFAMAIGTRDVRVQAGQ